MTGQDRTAGRGVKWSARAPLLLGYGAAAALVGGLGAWSLLTTLSGAIVASGQIQVAQNRQVVEHLDGGVVARINVVEGAPVAAGDILVELDGTLLRSELAIVQNQIFELAARSARLKAERDDAPAISLPADLAGVAADRAEVRELVEGQNRLFTARRETLAQQIGQRDKRIGQIASQIEGIEAQLASITAQLALIEEELAAQTELRVKGLTQATRVLALQREQARLQGQQGNLTAARAEAAGRVTEIEIEVLGLASLRREEAMTELRDVAARELELAERRRSLSERIARLDIRAPVSGMVLGLQVTSPRSVIRAAEPVLYLIPQDRPLIIAVQVATTDIDQLHIGQSARVHLSAFSTRTTPELAGQVTVVSADTLTDERAQAQYYRVEIALNPGEIDKLEDRALLPGMPVEAFIATESHTPLEYLVKPFTDYFARSLRES